MEQHTRSVPYQAPRVTVVGDIATLTRACDKNFGSADGYTFQGVTIRCTSG